MQQPYKILVVLAGILGIFIVYNFLLDSLWGSRQQQFNLACLDGPLNRTQELSGRLNVLLREHELALSIAHQYPSVATNLSLFHHRSTQLAANFEAYLRHLARTQDQMRDNMELMLAVKQAGRDFEQCKSAVSRSFSESECLGNWQEYEECVGRAEDVRREAERVREGEAETKLQIDLYIRLPNSSEPSIRVAERLYNESIRNNDKNRQELVNRLDYYEKERKAKSFQKETSVSKLIEIEKPYKECQESNPPPTQTARSTAAARKSASPSTPSTTAASTSSRNASSTRSTCSPASSSSSASPKTAKVWSSSTMSTAATWRSTNACCGLSSRPRRRSRRPAGALRSMSRA
jgi:hypothetical protein